MEEKKSGNSSGENTSNVRMPRRGKKLSPPLGQLKANNFYTGMGFKSCRKTIFVSCYQGHPTGIFGEISVWKDGSAIIIFEYSTFYFDHVSE